MTTKRIAKALCAWMVLGAALLAQSITSNIVGIVTDPAGASIPGAEIQVKDRATGATRTATSSTEGVFRITNLPPGGYDLTIKANGFKTYAQSELNLASQETRDPPRPISEPETRNWLASESETPDNGGQERLWQVTDFPDGISFLAPCWPAPFHAAGSAARRR